MRLKRLSIPGLAVLLLTCTVFAAGPAGAAPIEEKEPASGGAPLDVLSSQASQIFVPQTGDFKDRFILAILDAEIQIIDTETWDLAVDQPTGFDDSIGGMALLGNGTSLIVTLEGGDLARIELDNIGEENDEVESSSDSDEEDTETDCDDGEDDDDDGDTDCDDSDCADDDACEDVETDCDDDEDDDDDGDTDCDDSDCADDSACTGEEETDGAAGEDSSDPRIFVLSDETEGGTLGAIAADTDEGDEVVYFLNIDDSLLLVYDFEADSLASIELDSAPADIVFADGSDGQKVYVSAAEGSVYVLEEGGSEVGTITIDADAAGYTADPDLGAIAATPDGEFIYVVDTTNDVVWVIDASSDEVVDQQSGNSDDPVFIDSDENSGLDDIFLVDVTSPTSVYGYVSGAEGLTILDASDPDSAADDPKIVDQDTSTTDVLDPLALSGVPGPVAASTVDDGYVYTSNGDATVSVITENPFVTIDEDTSISLDGTTTTFSLTFQSDEAGTYRMFVNSDITESSGTELQGETDLTDADTDVTTDTIDIDDLDREVFEEGTNRIFIFVEDADGNLGRDAVDIDVDRPPPATTITSTHFGNEKAYVTFDKLTDEDINLYHIYAEPAESQSSPSCPGSIDFGSPEAEGELDHDACGEDCEGKVTGLTNGVAYCVAVQAEDDGGQLGEIATSSDVVFPERTVGAAGILGETGCSLNAGARGQGLGFRVIFILPFLFLLLMRHRKMVSILVLLLFPVVAFATDDAYVQPASTTSTPPQEGVRVEQINESAGVVATPPVETTTTPEMIESPSNIVIGKKPEWKWFSFELKGSMWFPQNDVVKDFYGTCCNLGAEAEFGLLYKSKFNATVAVGFFHDSGQAVGVDSGDASGDKTSLWLIPIRNSFIFRIDYKNEQVVVPYVGAGLDYVFFRESVDSDSIKGLKFGFHGMGGLAFLLDRIEDIGDTLEAKGIDDVYFTIEGRYSKIDSFKSTGLDLSGFSAYFGLLMAF
ncbi:MAG: hypothetical protein HYU99_11000 [Deltaproteobacteria bacterium]|nr:hypothetical protein [Deltaproteobacteria bacterium]